jgi:hypothetical protein
MERIKALVGILVVAGCFYYGWKILPPYMAEYQFQQEIQTIARTNEYSQVDIPAIREQVKKKIDETGVPIPPESVIIYRSGNFDVIIGANYTVHVDAIFPFDMTFHPAAKNGEKIDPVTSPATAP